jgi:hypothetical protein
MAKTLPFSQLVPGFAGEQFRLKPAKRQGRAGVQLDVLQPVASHATALTVVGRAVFVPSDRIPALCAALSRLSGGKDDPEPGAPPLSPEDDF